MKQFSYAALVGLLALTVAQFLTLSSSDVDLDVYFLDVGQGDSILASYPTGERLLVDTGKDSKVLRELDKTVPWYDKTIDYVLLTHGDLDHVGAMIEIFDRYRVRTLLVSEFFGRIEVEQQILDRAKTEGASVEILRQGDVLTFGSPVTNSLRILHPDSSCFDAYASENDCSLVGLLSYGEQSFLLTGDAGERVEPQIASQLDGPVSLLKVGHHGSRESTTAQLLEKAKPHYAVIQSGRENTYGHPHQEVLERLAAASSTVFNTKEDATVLASSDGKEMRLRKLFDKAGLFQSGVCAVLLYGFDASC